MNSIRQEYFGLLHYGASHFGKDHLSSLLTVGQQVAQDLLDSNISTLEHQCILLDFRGEGHCDKIIIKLIDYLRSIPVKKIYVIFNAHINITELDYPAVSIADSMLTYCNWFNDSVDITEYRTDAKFLCLMRRPSNSRARLASRLSSITDDMHMTFGPTTVPGELLQYQKYFNTQSLPIRLNSLTTDDIFNADDPLFTNCAVNIIAESSSQSDSECWSSIFITEKTFKAFKMLQLPIWWAVPGTVNCVREMGFDLFDDIIDHSYDSIVNESQRLSKVIHQIQQLNSMDLISLRQQLKERLNQNQNHLKTMAANQKRQYQQILKQLGLDTLA